MKNTNITSKILYSIHIYVYVCVCYLGKVGFGHVVRQESDPIKTLFISWEGRTISVVLLILTHHFSVKALELMKALYWLKFLCSSYTLQHQRPDSSSCLRLETHLELGTVLLHQEVQLEVMEVVLEGFLVIVHKKQRFVDKLLENVLHLLWLQVPQNAQHLREGKQWGLFEAFCITFFS